MALGFLDQLQILTSVSDRIARKLNKIIIKSENYLLALHHINQCLPLSLENLLTNENDLDNYSTQSSVNHQLALPQVKTINYGLHSIRYRAAKH